MSHSLAQILPVAPIFGMKTKVLTMANNVLFSHLNASTPWLPLYRKHAEQAPEPLPFCVPSPKREHWGCFWSLLTALPASPLVPTLQLRILF